MKEGNYGPYRALYWAPREVTHAVKQGYMLEHLSILQYAKRDNLLGADNQQGRPKTEPSTTTRLAPEKGEDIVWPAWRHAEVGRNDQPDSKE